MENRSEIVKLFNKYGFEYRKTASKENFLAFTFKSGFFHNAELVSLEATDKLNVEAEMESSAKDLERLGFSTKKSFYTSVAAIKKSLFDGFFSTSEWKEKIKDEYKQHCEKVLSLLPEGADSYSYINAPYKKNGVTIDKVIVDDVCESISLDGAKLIIIEAPAGFGKTCTSYEIINKLVSGEEDLPIPFFTEFSRDRQARIFSHIFIREVDRSFSAVNSSVVIEEVKDGRVAIVLDGFDELLHDKSTSSEKASNFDEAEPMLETISELLVKNSKIVLTSRRSAIFDGEMFNEWVKRNNDKFSIDRYRIENPEIRNWLPLSRLESLEEVGIDLNKLSNPVLLSFLRFLEESCFSSLCEQPSFIVKQYFQLMLEREMDRQQLRMNPAKQSELLAIVAEDMCDNNYTADSKEKIINLIKEKGSSLLEEVRSLYSPRDKPTIDKLATTLSNHAFFDRSNQGEDSIEFVNEFVFGNYISEVVVNSEDEWLASDERFIEPAVFSYIPRNDKDRKLLWDKLAYMRNFLDPTSKMRFESLLTESVKECDYHQCEISSAHFDRITFFEKGFIEGSVFNECVFKNSYFYLNSFHDVTFLSCVFWDCQFVADSIDNISTFNCNDNTSCLEEILRSQEEMAQSTKKSVTEYILSKIWPASSAFIESQYFFTKTLFNTDEFSRKDIIEGIRALKQEGFLEDARKDNFVAINKAKISDIKSILGR